MATLSSNQVSVYPVEIRTTCSMEDLVSVINESLYDPGVRTSAQTGWGSIDDSETRLGLFPDAPFEVHGVNLGHRWLREKDTITARYYWWQRDPRAIRLHGEGASPETIHRLTAGDVVFFREPGRIVAIVTVRERTQRHAIAQGLRELVAEADSQAIVSEDSGGFDISEDFFLWLLYRLQEQQHLSGNLYLTDLTEINSTDRSMRGTRFQDEATVERIDLAALVAIGTKAFGPAKLTLSATNPDAIFQLELFHDGGFQPFRRSNYETRDFDGAEQAIALVEDLWTVVLPELRASHLADDEWNLSGRLKLRRAARDNVLRLLGTNNPDSNS